MRGVSTPESHPARATPGGPLDFEAVVPGTRVVVRHRLASASGFGATDVVGELVEVTADAVRVATRTGETVVRRDTVIVAKIVPPAPTRRGPAHRRIGLSELHEIMADGWPAVTTDRLGGWLLRSSSGFTSRANSVLPLGDPGVAFVAAIGLVRDWYAARGATPTLQLPLPSGAEPGVDPLGAALLETGWTARTRTWVMTAPTAGVPALTDGAQVRVDAALSPFWLTAYAQQRSVLAGVTEQVLTGSGGQLFLSIDGPGGESDPIAIARLSIAPGWAGLSCVWTSLEHRRAGLARALASAAAMLARDHRMPSIYLQVEADNTPAIALYESLGFEHHSDYMYLESR